MILVLEKWVQFIQQPEAAALKFKSSRIGGSKWLRFGDRKTRFFHGSTVDRRRRNGVDCLQNDLGDGVPNMQRWKRWCKISTASYFRNLGELQN
ncbi:hypothetical protein Fmac_017062 [Flemingia macrophylla]|uniref:Ycf15 n=1 Tax=Flemingia macrophylla TaxID=520843 RepID=A0ABD1M176_9FABA